MSIVASAFSTRIKLAESTAAPPRQRASIKHSIFVNEDTGTTSVLMLDSHAAIDSLYDQMRAPNNPRRQVELDRQRVNLHGRLNALNAGSSANR